MSTQYLRTQQYPYLSGHAPNGRGGYTRIGQVGYTIYKSDITSDLRSRGYYPAATSPPPTSPPPTSPPAFTKADAIRCGVDKSLNHYGYARRCSGGTCYIEATKYEQIASYALTLANNARAVNRCPYPVSGALSGFGNGEEQEPTWWEKYGAIIGAGLSAMGAFITASQISKNMQEIAKLNNIPQPTEADLNAAIMAYIAANPNLTSNIGPGGQMASAFPEWMKYALFAGGAVVIVTMLKK